MKYLGRLLLYCIIFFVTASVGCVLFLRFIPVTVTPYKAVQSLEQGRWLAGPQSKWVPIENISPWVPRAVIATEDNNFTSHRGFDFEAIRIAVEERQQGRRQRGASTISQQTAKNAFCTPASTWLRKGMEGWFTVLIEALWGKERIMEVYLNVIEVAPGQYGVQTAAREYFACNASQLDQRQAAMIATVLPNPARMKLADPSAYVKRRSAQVVTLMNKLPEPDYHRGR